MSPVDADGDGLPRTSPEVGGTVAPRSRVGDVLFRGSSGTQDVAAGGVILDLLTVDFALSGEDAGGSFSFGVDGKTLTVHEDATVALHHWVEALNVTGVTFMSAGFIITKPDAGGDLYQDHFIPLLNGQTYAKVAAVARTPVFCPAGTTIVLSANHDAVGTLPISYVEFRAERIA